MKTMKFLTYAVFVFFLGFAISSCEGPEGPQGPAGTNGTNGTNGVDGNANVQTYIFTNPTWTAPSFGDAAMSLDTFGKISDANIQNDVILGYIKHEENYAVFTIPGMVNTSAGKMNYQTYIFDSDFDVWANTYVIASRNPDGTETAAANLPTVEWVKIIVIESTDTTTTAGNGKSVSPQQAVYNELEAAGVDVNDYYAVCAYYGINPE